ncbi:YbjQ family protein [Candidatus Gracilibacteria bacterium]|nr:YbjQ family protein [Candidatus Gracilibacteria bacterium]
MDFIIFIVIILLGLFFGKRAEKKHYASILEREEKYKHIPVLSDKDTRDMPGIEGQGILCTSGTVVAIDAFKKLMAGFVNIFGGRMKAYESLVDRARREVVLNVKQKAEQAGYNAIVNLRIETSSISKNAKQNVGSVEALAYATAIRLPKV